MLRIPYNRTRAHTAGPVTNHNPNKHFTWKTNDQIIIIKCFVYDIKYCVSVTFC